MGLQPSHEKSFHLSQVFCAIGSIAFFQIELYYLEAEELDVVIAAKSNGICSCQFNLIIDDNHVGFFQLNSYTENILHQRFLRKAKFTILE